MSVVQDAKRRVSGAALLCAVVLVLGFGWSLTPESVNVPPPDRDDDRRVIQLYAQSTFSWLTVQAVGRSNTRGKILSVKDHFDHVWAAEVTLRRGESVTFVVTAQIHVLEPTKSHALACQIFENDVLAAPEARDVTSRENPGAEVLCKYTSVA